MLSTMTTSHSSQRRDTSIVLPSLKFLWEVYRAVLDILKTNSRLEHVYHDVAARAFKFCKEHRRKAEFRRLCETLRGHFQHFQKFGGTAALFAANAHKLKGWDGWTMESLECHLSTRFTQLDIATSLEQYSEGFRTVEDIYSIMQLSKKAPKAKILSQYYEKLINIFWVSGNYLFHAYAWYKYYTLCSEYNKAMTNEQKVEQASCVLLASLSIPTLDANTSLISDDILGGDNDDVANAKTSRLAALLGFSVNTTRGGLLLELKGKNLVNIVPKEVKELYEILEEVSFPKKNNNNAIQFISFRT